MDIMREGRKEKGRKEEKWRKCVAQQNKEINKLKRKQKVGGLISNP